MPGGAISRPELEIGVVRLVLSSAARWSEVTAAACVRLLLLLLLVYLHLTTLKRGMKLACMLCAACVLAQTVIFI